MKDKVEFHTLSDIKREAAYQKYMIIAPYINNLSSLKKIAKERNIPLRTLTSWVNKYKTLGLAGLSRQARADQGNSRTLDKRIYKIIEALYFKYPASSCANIHRMLKPYCTKEAIKYPSYRTVCKIIQSIPEDIITLSHKGSKAYKDKYDLLCIREAERPNQIWQADHVLMDIEVLNDKNNPERPWLTVIIDDCSRIICGYDLSFMPPSAAKTSLCLRHAIWRKQNPAFIAFGVPEALYTDHGSDFTSTHIEQVCIELKIELIFSQVGQPRGRGKIERFFRTLNQKLISDVHIINKKPLSLKQIDTLIFNFIVDYNQTIHSETKMTPVHKWSAGGFIPNILNSLEKLDLLLLTESKPRTVRRDGIHFQGLRYIDTILVEYVGKEVIIRYSPSDITSIRVFYQGQYICQPICSELSNQTISVKEIQQARNKRRYELKKKIKQQKSVVDAVIEASRKDLELTLSTHEEDVSTIDSKPVNKIRVYKNE